MLLADDGGIERGARGGQRVDGGVDTELGDGTGKNRRRVEVRERGGRSGVGQVVGGDVDGLNGGDGAFLG